MMKKAKFYYNPHTCQYEPVRWQARQLLFRMLIYSLVVVSAALVLNGLYYATYAKYKEGSSLRKENEALKLYHELINKDITYLQNHIKELQMRDDELYRTIFEAEPISSSIRTAGVGGRERYADLMGKDIKLEGLVLSSLKRIDQMKKQVEIQSRSYEELLAMAKNKEMMSKCIPAIQPIVNKQLHKLSSGYGMRIDPIYGIRKMHEGMDFAAPRGTPIYAPGAGIVRETKRTRNYGKMILIDHGYGYRTLYAHLDRFKVKKGETVTRGQHIGYVGNTGKSTSPHLHYEVHYKSEKVNPIYFFFQDISQADYDKLLQLASVENKSLE